MQYTLCFFTQVMLTMRAFVVGVFIKSTLLHVLYIHVHVYIQYTRACRNSYVHACIYRNQPLTHPPRRCLGEAVWEVPSTQTHQTLTREPCGRTDDC